MYLFSSCLVYRQTAKLFPALKLFFLFLVLTTRGVCGIWRVSRRYCTRKVTARPCMTWLSRWMVHQLLQRKLYVTVISDIFINTYLAVFVSKNSTSKVEHGLSTLVFPHKNGEISGNGEGKSRTNILDVLFLRQIILAGVRQRMLFEMVHANVYFPQWFGCIWTSLGSTNRTMHYVHGRTSQISAWDRFLPERV